MKLLLLIISFSCFGQVLNSQINDSLAILTEEVRIEDFVWDPPTPWRMKSVKYDIMIEDDSLIVISNSSDIEISSNDKRNTRSSTNKYIANIKDIGKIEFINEYITPQYGDPYYDCIIEILSTRNTQIFDVIYEDTIKRKTWHIPMRAYNHEDSIKFRRISELLNQSINPSKNSMAANCELDKIHEWSGERIDAIDNINLETEIHLNGQIATELAVQELISDYLKAQNIKGVLGYVIINNLNQLETIWTQQNSFYHLTNSSKELPSGYAYQIENVGVMSDQQLEDIFNILKSQKWESGSCQNKPQKSYLDLFVKNKDFKETKDR